MGSTPPPVTFTTPNSGSGQAGAYGLSSDAASANFDLAGLPQLGTGTLAGSDLLNQFVAAGSGRGDPTVVAAIQQALLLGGFYGSSTYVPQMGVVKAEDGKALAGALNQLAIANAANPSGAGFPTMGVAQFLTTRAAQGAANGVGAAQTQTQVAAIHKPDPVQVASTFEKVAQQEEGRRPSAAETQQFVSDYMGRYEQTQKQNIAAATNAATPPADPTTAPLSPPQQLPHGLVGESGTYVHGSSAQPLDLTTSMMSLQDVINETANPGGGSADPNMPTMVDQKDLPDVASSAEAYVRENNPGAVAKNDLGNTLNSFLNLITTKLV